jgi:hypothetical protein
MINNKNNVLFNQIEFRNNKKGLKVGIVRDSFVLGQFLKKSFTTKSN